MTKKLSIFLIWLLFSSPAMAAGPEKAEGKPNRLINSSSPYLRQHAYNPVDWHVWGKGAFDKARKENKPVFLSVGYSTCHWCHVMARESYSDAGVAAIINKHFIAIKVDRERKPDVDETYMIATELISRRGGWPNNVFLTPDLKPFYGGTYFPKKDFKSILNTIAEQWTVARPRLVQDAERFSYVIEQIMTRRFETKSITPASLKAAVASMMRSHDHLNGGFSVAPKFPQEAVLLFLTHMAKQDGNQDAKNAVRRTLTGVLNGGIHDQVGGGFHRYAVDPRWMVPHFEKMLYNQGQMVLVLLDAYELTGEKRYADVARDAIDAVLRDMLSPEGAFYSAFDADSEGAEGTYYVWTPETLEKALGKKDAAFVMQVFGVKTSGNFHGKTVLNFNKPPYETAHSLKMDEAQLFAQLKRIKAVLLKNREKRERPHRDDKAITEWNGMMIRALARAASVLDDNTYRNAALKAASFFQERMLRKDGRLHRIFFEGKAGIEATLDDYVHLGLGYIGLYDLTADKVWLERAEALAQTVIRLFEDKKLGDFFRVVNKETFTRGKSRSDGPVPSGNAVALEMFAKLARRSRNPVYRKHAEAIAASLSGIALNGPMTNSYALRATDMLQRGEPGKMAYLGKGVVKAYLLLDKEKKQAKVMLNIAPGWHVNSDKPLEDFLIPTSLKLSGEGEKGKVSYPKPVIRKLKFNDNKMALYEGQLELTVPLTSKKNKKGVAATLHLQACNDQICLEPETATLKLFR